MKNRYSATVQANEASTKVILKGGRPYIKVCERNQALHQVIPGARVIAAPATRKNGDFVYFPEKQVIAPNGSITINPEQIVMKATIYDERGKIIATGLASEIRNSSDVNTTSVYENTETSAKGRAMKNAGFGILKDRFAADLNGDIATRLKDINRMIPKMELKRKDGKQGAMYVDAECRILAFLAVYPEGHIETDIVYMDDNKVLVEARCYDENDNLIANGYDEEMRSSSFVNKGSYLENAETSAIARAIGYAGIGSDEDIASADEIANSWANQKMLAPAPDQTIRYIKDKLVELEIDAEVFKEYCKYDGAIEEVDQYHANVMVQVIALTEKQREAKAQKAQASAQAVGISNIAATGKPKSNMVAKPTKKTAAPQPAPQPAPVQQPVAQTPAPVQQQAPVQTQVQQNSAPIQQNTAQPVAQSSPAPVQQTSAPVQTVAPVQQMPAQTVAPAMPSGLPPVSPTQQNAADLLAPAPAPSDEGWELFTDMMDIPFENKEAEPVPEPVPEPAPAPVPESVKGITAVAPSDNSGEVVPVSNSFYGLPNTSGILMQQPGVAPEVPESAKNILCDIGENLAGKPIGGFSPMQLLYCFQHTESKSVKEACLQIARINGRYKAVFVRASIDVDAPVDAVQQQVS